MKPFNVIWFEDNLKSFDRIIPQLRNHAKMNNHEFVPDTFDHYPNDFDIKLFEGKYSIAFIDLNLNNGQKGIEIINVLRNKGAFIDVLLYSNNAAELKDLTEGKNYVEGIFRHATLDGIEQKMKDVFDQVIYKETMTIDRNDKYEAQS